MEKTTAVTKTLAYLRHKIKECEREKLKADIQWVTFLETLNYLESQQNRENEGKPL